MSKPIDKEFEKPINNLEKADASKKQMEEALRESEEKYRTLAENIALGIFRSTPGPKGSFIEVNSAFAKLLGYTNKKELLEIDVAQIYQNPKDRLKFSKKISRKGSVKNEELYLKKKDGTPIIVSETAIAVRDKNGKLLYFDGIVEEITQRKKAEEELLIHKTYLEKLFNSAPEAIVLHDNDDLIADVNAEFTRMFGYSRKEAIGKPINELVASEEFQDEAALISEKVIRGERIELDTKRRRKDGTLIDVSILGAPIVHDGKQIGDYAIYRDITERKKAEEELLIQKSYLERLFNSAPEAIVLHDNNDLVVNVNDEFTRMFGYSREEAIGKPINELVASEEFQDEAATLSEKVIHGERVEADTKRKRKDGTLMDVWILGAPIIHDRKQMGVYAIYRDIAERKKVEEELHLQKTYFEKLFNSAPEAIGLQDKNGLIVDVNDEFTKMFGYCREEAIGKTINELVAPEELQDEASMFSHKVIHGERVEADSIRKRKDGTLMDVSILGAPIVHGGKPVGDYAIYRDITERKKAEEELYLQKTYLEKLFNSAPEAIVWHDNNDIVVNVNDEFTTMFGYSREEAIGRPINELVAPEELQDEASMFSHKVIHGERVEADSIRKRKDGTLFDVWILGAPIIHEGKQIGVYAIYRDITERKKTEEARIRLKEEARMARDIQVNLLPKSNPEISGYDIAGMSLPALNVGGDYYDFIRLDEHQLAVGLGDVSGKGLAAALVMSNLQATIRGQTFFDGNANECLQRANKLLFGSTDSKTFVSLFYGILDTQKNALCYANAGQNTPLIFSPDKKPLPLKTHGLALGMQEDVSYQKDEISINPGDRLLIYSDGITEAMNERMEEFGDEKLREIVQRYSGDSAGTLIEKIIAAVTLHFGDASQNDDMTIIILKRKP
ncbi:MAG: PAS domain S-box protein [Candidatus Heimdallarchaeota archaeon]